MLPTILVETFLMFHFLRLACRGQPASNSRGSRQPDATRFTVRNFEKNFFSKRTKLDLKMKTRTQYSSKTSPLF